MLNVMTFNLKYASDDGPQPWPMRRPLVAERIRSARPDLIGTQEGIYGQLQDIAVDLPGYAWIGTGRDGGSRGEFMAIFYRHRRLQPLEFDHFWLSDTPETVGSSTWGNHNRRMVTWVRFRDRRSGRELIHANTHFDFDDDWHERAIGVLLGRLGGLDPQVPLVLTGDFNADAPDSVAYRRLVTDGPFTDQWVGAQRRRGGTQTFHDWQGPGQGPRIDWILTRGPVHVPAIATIAGGAVDGLWPSDHFPVHARLVLDP